MSYRKTISKTFGMLTTAGKVPILANGKEQNLYVTRSISMRSRMRAHELQIRNILVRA
jgi:hypothetical protein